jgi:acyl dehydratase
MPVQVKQQRFSLITEKGLADLRQLIGIPIEDTLEPWCHEATRDNIRHWAHGIGDDNPLWCDPAYAAKSRYGRLVAPPLT